MRKDTVWLKIYDFPSTYWVLFPEMLYEAFIYRLLAANRLNDLEAMLKGMLSVYPLLVSKLLT